MQLLPAEPVLDCDTQVAANNFSRGTRQIATALGGQPNHLGAQSPLQDLAQAKASPTGQRI